MRVKHYFFVNITGTCSLRNMLRSRLSKTLNYVSTSHR